MASKPGRPATKGSWGPGKSGNPSGRKKATPDELELRRLCRETTPEVLTRLKSIALKSKDPRAAIRACEVILDRGFGRPPQHLELSGNLNTTPDLSQYTTEELLELEALYERARARRAS